MVGNSYQPPVDKLLTYGDAQGATDNWPDYLALGLTADHVPELIRMALDPELYSVDWNHPQFSAPIHALRALGQLHAEAAIDPLIPLLDKTDDDDGLAEELPVVFAAIGPAAIPAVFSLNSAVLTQSVE